ncbi:hypothetical protein [Streptomyces fradiae]|uniref:hypothetical protein n=1 Tax=Streptomyces fradiae TaxID=1906 RepID=UPI0038000EAC
MPDTTPLAPMTPHAAISAFNYLRAVQADDIDAAREFAGAEPRMPELLVDVAERIVVPVTALPGPEAGEPCEHSFLAAALGRPTIVVRSNVPYPTRTDYLPHCTVCANDLPNVQRWNDLMNDRYGL